MKKTTYLEAAQADPTLAYVDTFLLGSAADRHQAAEELARISDPAAAQTLLAAYENEADPSVRMQIFRGLLSHQGIMSEGERQAAFEKATHDEAFVIRMMAQQVLDNSN